VTCHGTVFVDMVNMILPLKQRGRNDREGGPIGPLLQHPPCLAGARESQLLDSYFLFCSHRHPARCLTLVGAFTPNTLTRPLPTSSSNKKGTSKNAPLTTCDTTERQQKHVRDGWVETAVATESASLSSMPPWLLRYYFSKNIDDDIPSKQRSEQLKHIESTLSLSYHSVLSSEDAQEVLAAMCGYNYEDELMQGIADFVQTLLEYVNDDNKNDGSSPYVTKDILLASIWHYAECFAARRKLHMKDDGDWMGRNRLSRTKYDNDRTGTNTCDEEKAKLVTAASTPKVIPVVYASAKETSPSSALGTEQVLVTRCLPIKSSFDSSSTSSTKSTLSSSLTMKLNNELMDQNKNLQVLKIWQGAKQIKRAETLARAVLSPSVWKEEATRMRGLLLSVNNFDWRALMIRCVACLYRLDGILECQDHSPYSFTTKSNCRQEVVRTAREALRIYATLSQQLGLLRLKAAIEDRAFQILYPRSYRAVQYLYNNDVPMQFVSTYLRSKFTAALIDDDALMSQLEDMQITSRVKEPYSFWRKLVRKRFEMIRAGLLSGRNGDEALSMTSSTSSTLSVSQIQDVVALRVIIKSRKWYEQESVEIIRARERLLCYYVQQKLQSKWPSINHKKSKDYIRHPKPNDYQSLHYISSISEKNLNFDFEVQVRSHEMHQVCVFATVKC
jgi:Region found in RelA / SpoT proteins